MFTSSRVSRLGIRISWFIIRPYLFWFWLFLEFICSWSDCKVITSSFLDTAADWGRALAVQRHDRSNSKVTEDNILKTVRAIWEIYNALIFLIMSYRIILFILYINYCIKHIRSLYLDKSIGNVEKTNVKWQANVTTVPFNTLLADLQ